MDSDSLANEALPNPSSAGRDLEARKAQLTASRRALLEQRLAKGQGAGVSWSIPARTDPQENPLSFGQERIWFLQQLEPGAPHYNRPLALLIHGELDLPKLEAALAEIFRRHHVLRAIYVEKNGPPEQHILPAVPAIRLEVEDLTALTGSAQDAEARRLALADAWQPFKLDQERLLRARLLRLQAQEHLLLLTLHHIAFDAWSAKIFISELGILLAGPAEGVAGLPDLPIQYADYAAWQRSWLLSRPAQAQLAYWKKQLMNAPPPLELPGDRPRTTQASYRGAIHRINLDAALLAMLQRLGAQEQATNFMILLTAFLVLLYRYTRQCDLVIGVPVAGRRHVESEALIGMFVNSLALRFDLSGNPGFRELLQRVRAVVLQALANQDLPFERLVQELQPERRQSRTPLFQMMFNLRNIPESPVQPGELQIERFDFDDQIAQFDLSIEIEPTRSGLDCDFVFSTDIFNPPTIRRMAGHYQTLLGSLLADPDQAIDHLPFLSQVERKQLLEEWNATICEFPGQASLAKLFEEWVEKTPQAPALIYENQILSYTGLNRRANLLARDLLRLDVQAGEIVGLHLERSPALIVGLLAILKAGAACLPLDPAYPIERLSFMLQDSGARLCISQPELVVSELADQTSLLMLDQDGSVLGRNSGKGGGPDQQNLEELATGESLAYVMYTSGSTGTPKGICIPQRAVTRLVINTNYLDIRPEDRLSQAANLSFDAAIFEIWGALLNGACLVIIAQETALSPDAFARLIRAEDISIVFLTTALFNQFASVLPDAFQGIRAVLFGGEAVTPGWVRKVLQAGPPQRLLHMYGPTENTTYTTWYEVQNVPEEAQTIPIGRPLANTQVYVLDEHQEPVPLGVPAELYIGGDGLATGYLNRAELTAEKFIANPFGHGRLYRSGDLVRQMEDGNLEFVGRVDYQVKLRGFRVELGEIETALEAHFGVSQALVLLREDNPGEKRLVAYLTLRPAWPGNPLELRAHLKTRLPEFMLPSAYIFLEQFPVTQNGKIDRWALPAPGKDSMDTGKMYSPPRDDLEQSLCDLWEQILNLRPVGIYDNFFDLGGHSLLATQAITRMKDFYAIELPLRTFFNNPTVASLADELRRSGVSSRAPGPPSAPGEVDGWESGEL